MIVFIPNRFRNLQTKKCFTCNHQCRFQTREYQEYDQSWLSTPKIKIIMIFMKLFFGKITFLSCEDMKTLKNLETFNLLTFLISIYTLTPDNKLISY